MKTFKIRMLSGCDCGCKGAELQVISKGYSAPSTVEVKEALLRAGYKIKQSPAANHYEVIN